MMQWLLPVQCCWNSSVFWESTKNYPDGLNALVQEFLPHVGHGLVREGLEKIAGKFASPEHMAPRCVADFDELTDPEEREILQRDAYEQVNYLLEELGIK